MKHAGSRVVGGDGVIAMVEKYRKDGGLFFHHNNARYEGTGGAMMPSDLMPASAVNFRDLASYDAAHFPAARERFLRHWISEPGQFGLVQQDDKGVIPGYGVRRTCCTGYKTVPLFAQDRLTAENHLDGLIAGREGEPFFPDIPVINTDAAAMVAGRHMNPVFFPARLSSTPDPIRQPVNEVFGITTFELREQRPYRQP